ncbi:hypothetical protein HNQ92_004596 [Rhabdobacter roseus]|uniref:Uncharacterized protein n=1 Tax=Rhabdobacter roseus TaxID=1655419 RepID=A0A840TQ15_9BACT|nr:hypothetical protein [Rhabdobacter roseus]
MLILTSLMPGFIEVITYRMEEMDFEDNGPPSDVIVCWLFSSAIGALHTYSPLGLQQSD